MRWRTRCNSVARGEDYNRGRGCQQVKRQSFRRETTASGQLRLIYRHHRPESPLPFSEAGNRPLWQVVGRREAKHSVGKNHANAERVQAGAQHRPKPDVRQKKITEEQCRQPA